MRTNAPKIPKSVRVPKDQERVCLDHMWCSRVLVTMFWIYPSTQDSSGTWRFTGNPDPLKKWWCHPGMESWNPGSVWEVQVPYSPCLSGDRAAGCYDRSRCDLLHLFAECLWEKSTCASVLCGKNLSWRKDRIDGVLFFTSGFTPAWFQTSNMW